MENIHEFQQDKQDPSHTRRGGFEPVNPFKDQRVRVQGDHEGVQAESDQAGSAEH